MFELLQYYASQEKYRGLCGSAISYVHFQMICLLGLLQNLNKVCHLKLFFFYDPANVGHPVNLSYNSIYEEFSRTRTIQASNRIE